MSEELSAFIRLLDKRYSCRGFLDRPVEREKIKLIIQTAQKVPSWCNSQPWQLAICSPEKTKLLADVLTKAAIDGMQSPDIIFPESYRGVYKERRSNCGWQLYEAVGVEKGDRSASQKQMMENFRFFGAPQVAVVTTPKELGAYGAVDCGAFVTAFTLAAQGLGIATIAQAAIAGLAPVVRECLCLSSDRNILCAISFGYENKDHPANQFRTDRAESSDVIDWY